MTLANKEVGKTELGDGNMPVHPHLMDEGETMLVVIEEAAVFSLLVQDPGIPTKEFRLKQGENTLGRDPKCDIFLDDPSVSRNHSSIVVASKAVSVRDLGSKNGTYIKRQNINYEVRILPGTEIRFGMVRTTLRRKEGG